MSEAKAPALSTYQDTTTFEYSKVKIEEKARNHLGPHNESDVTEKINDYYSIDGLVEFLSQQAIEGGKAESIRK